ncbi:hypothetical protein Emed_006901 [Eimeria media]
MGPLKNCPQDPQGGLMSLGGPLDTVGSCEGPRGPLNNEAEGPLGPLNDEDEWPLGPLTVCTGQPADLLDTGSPSALSLLPAARQIEGGPPGERRGGPQGESGSWQLKRQEETADEAESEEEAPRHASESDATSEVIHLTALEAIAAADEAAAAVAALREWRQQQQQLLLLQQEQQARQASSSADSLSSACKESSLLRQVDSLAHAVLGAPSDLSGGPPSEGLHKQEGPPTEGLLSNVAATQQQSSSLQHLLSEARSSAAAAAAADGVYAQLTQQQQGLADVPQAPRLHAELALLEARTMAAASPGSAATAAATAAAATTAAAA